MIYLKLICAVIVIVGMGHLFLLLIGVQRQKFCSSEVPALAFICGIGCIFVGSAYLEWIGFNSLLGIQKCVFYWIHAGDSTPC